MAITPASPAGPLSAPDDHSSAPSGPEGLASTARAITSAAMIMVSVFAVLLLTPDIELKMFAVGLSVAIALDASIVRVIFVPASTALVRNANWSFPVRLDRLLPHVDLEGVSVIDIELREVTSADSDHLDGGKEQ
jgi:uncharacterized membrane protein YdfJ with MMPL/SSD domain